MLCRQERVAYESLALWARGSGLKQALARYGCPVPGSTSSSADQHVVATVALPDDPSLWRGMESIVARRLIAAAVVEFSREGFHGATTRQICSAAGLSPAGMYVHFPSKTDLLYGVCRIGHEGALSAVQRALTLASADPLDRVRAYVRAFTLFNADYHALSRVVQYEFKWLPPDDLHKIAGFREDFERLMADELKAGVASGAFDVPDVGGTVLAILSLGIDVARWYSSTRDERPDGVAELYAELAARMISGRGPESSTS